jgi:putative transcriptional regulator
LRFNFRRNCRKLIVMTDAQYLSGRLLLAMPGMFDPNFDHAVIAMCVHDENGALGIGIGHEREGLSFHELLEEVGIDPGAAPDCPVQHGGPVEPGRGFVLHSTDWGGAETMIVDPLCALSASLDILRAIAEGRGPQQWLIALGYAGWGPGQLDGEMRRHGWYAAQGNSGILFDTPTERRWTAAWKADGIDPALLAHETGRA